MSAEPIDHGGSAYPHGEIVQDMRDEKGLFAGTRVCEQSPGQSYRADVAKECLAALLGREDLDDYSPDGLAGDAVSYADALIRRLKGGAA